MDSWDSDDFFLQGRCRGLGVEISGLLRASSSS